jgi:hypothetical protein
MESNDTKCIKAIIFSYEGQVLTADVIGKIMEEFAYWCDDPEDCICSVCKQKEKEKKLAQSTLDFQND